MRNKNILKIDSRHPSVQNKVLKDGFNGNKNFMDDYRLLEKGGLPAFRDKKPTKNVVQQAIDETVFRNELRRELSAPDDAFEKLGATATSELAQITHIKEALTIQPLEYDEPEPHESGYDSREKIA